MKFRWACRLIDFGLQYWWIKIWVICFVLLALLVMGLWSTLDYYKTQGFKLHWIYWKILCYRKSNWRRDWTVLKGMLFSKVERVFNFRTELQNQTSKSSKILHLLPAKTKWFGDRTVKDAREANPQTLVWFLWGKLVYSIGWQPKVCWFDERAIEKDPNNHVLYFNLGVITAEQGERDKARSYYESAIELDSS